MSVQSSEHPVASVLSVVVHDANVLLVRRTNPPDAGKWGYPGGWIDPGETMAQASVRELFEEPRCGQKLDVCSTHLTHSTTTRRGYSGGNS